MAGVDFAAAIPEAEFVNWVSHDGTADIARTNETEFFGTPWKEAARAISPSKRRRYNQEARSRFGMVSSTCRCGTGASMFVPGLCVQIANRLG